MDGSFFSDTDLRGSLSAGLSLPLSDKRYIATNTAMTENTPIVASIRIVLVFRETFTDERFEDVPG